jgi:hypothetical protein
MQNNLKFAISKIKRIVKLFNLHLQPPSFVFLMGERFFFFKKITLRQERHFLKGCGKQFGANFEGLLSLLPFR